MKEPVLQQYIKYQITVDEVTKLLKEDNFELTSINRVVVKTIVELNNKIVELQEILKDIKCPNNRNQTIMHINGLIWALHKLILNTDELQKGTRLEW